MKIFVIKKFFGKMCRSNHVKMGEKGKDVNSMLFMNQQKIESI